MSDMIKATEPKSDQWNFDDFQSGPLTFTIESVKVKGGQEQPVEITLAGTTKFYRPCKSMSRCLVFAWGPDSSKYVGRSLTLYGDPKVKWGGMEVGGIRISHMSDIAEPITMALTVTRANKKPFTVKPLVDVPAATDMPPKAVEMVRKNLQDAAALGTEALQQTWEKLDPKFKKALAGDKDGFKEAAKKADEGRAQ